MLSAAGSLHWLRDVLGRLVRAAAGRGRGVAARLRRAVFRPVPVGRADAACRPGHKRRVLRARPAPRPRARCVARCFEGVAFGLRDSLELVRVAGRRAASRPASPAAALRASCGSRSSPRCWGCRSRRTAVSEGAAFGAALLGGVAAGVFADAEDAVRAACARAGRWSPSRRGSAVRRALRALPWPVSDAADA